MEQLIDPALLLLRVLIAVIFGASGWSHVTAARKRAESLGMPVAATFALGLAELAGAASVLLGVMPAIGASVLIIVMIGAIYKKVAVWKTGFFGESSNGWYYDVLYAACNLVILTTGGGGWIVTEPWLIA